MTNWSGTGKVVFAGLIGATIGLGLFLWVSPLLGGQCLIICDPFRAVGVGAGLGALLALARVRSARKKRRLLGREGGAETLKKRKQKRALWIGAVFFFLMAVFPPWTVTTLARGGRATLTHASHYRFIWRAPSVDDEVEAASVDGERLLIGWAVVAVLTGTAVIGAELSAEETEESG